MNVVVFDSKMNEVNEMIDLPDVEGQYILYIGAREGQVHRVTLKNQVACGWWQLMRAGYIDRRGRLVPEAFKGFDCVIFAHPRRVYEPVRETYEKLIEAVRTL